MTIIDIISQRYSVRRYQKSKLDEKDKDLVKQLIENLDKGPFGNSAKFTLIEKPEALKKEKVKLGTYGFISNAQYFIAGTIEKFDFSEVDYGYLLEKIILRLTEAGMGTCWVGGTFKRKDYFKLLKIEENEIIPAITPVGYPAIKKSLRERLGIKMTDGTKRNPFETLFFDNDLTNPLIYNPKDEYMIALEMVRLAPSAVNRQPWRVIRIENKFHFFINRNKFMSFNKTVDLQKVDLGIALAHFQLTLKHFGKKGIWHIKNPEVCDLEYIISWILE